MVGVAGEDAGQGVLEGVEALLRRVQLPEGEVDLLRAGVGGEGGEGRGAGCARIPPGGEVPHPGGGGRGEPRVGLEGGGLLLRGGGAVPGGAEGGGEQVVEARVLRLLPEEGADRRRGPREVEIQDPRPRERPQDLRVPRADPLGLPEPAHRVGGQGPDLGARGALPPGGARGEGEEQIPAPGGGLEEGGVLVEGGAVGGLGVPWFPLGPEAASDDLEEARPLGSRGVAREPLLEDRARLGRLPGREEGFRLPRGVTARERRRQGEEEEGRLHGRTSRNPRAGRSP